ncbi:MAG: CoA transferase subunit A [Acidobacteriota bacterium]|nr:CoA transferase subunit A [Acidobacteriota bacterium]
MVDKRSTVEEMVGELRPGMTVGFGGWGSRRKPMAVVRAIVRAGIGDLTVVSYGGPDVGLLCAAGLVRKIVFGFVTLDSIALDPHFRAARQAGRLEAMEIDEGMLYLGLSAAGQRVPFLPTRAGLGSDVLRVNPGLRTVRSPYEDGEELVAMPALDLDVAFVHMNRADRHGNGQVLGPDPFFDDLYLGAARRRFVTAEKVVEPGRLTDEGPMQSIVVTRLLTDGVAEAPRGAHFTSCPPDYGRDEAFQSRYAKSAADKEAWTAFRHDFLDVDEEGYLAAVAAGAAGPAAGR